MEINPCFKMELANLFESYRQGADGFWTRVDGVRSREERNPIRLAALDALSGVVRYGAGDEREARKLWNNTLLSSDASNASKMIAHAGMACLSLEEGGMFWFGKAVDELSGLSRGFDANPWVAESLGNLLLVLVAYRGDFEHVQEIYRVAVDVCNRLETDEDKGIKEAALEIRADCAMYYAVSLMMAGEHHKAELQITREAITRYEILGYRFSAAFGYDMLSHICRRGGRNEEAIVIAEKAWELYHEDAGNKDVELELCVELWNLYGLCGQDPETSLSDLLAKQGVAPVVDYLDAVYERGGGRIGEENL